jgi:hypothetical protein
MKPDNTNVNAGGHTEKYTSEPKYTASDSRHAWVQKHEFIFNRLIVSLDREQDLDGIQGRSP